MDGKKKRTRKSAESSNKDISPVLDGWDYKSGAVNVRKIVGMDGTPKLQLRVDLGLLQMEITGRPDGRRPHGCESLLDYYEKKLKDHQHRNGTELGFHLTPAQCQLLRDEAAQYYQRYLSLFVLEEFRGVIRDTARNLRAIELCGKYAIDEQDRLILEQYRPYIIMMNARARASIHLRAARPQKAIRSIRRGLRQIREFFVQFGQEEAYKRCHEVRLLKQFGREIQGKLPMDPVRALNRKLEQAVKDERYEEAARLRDEIEKRKAESQQSSGQ